MAEEKKAFDYNLILADLEAKRAALDAAIVSLRIAAATGALTANGSSSPIIGTAPQIYGSHPGMSTTSGSSGYSGYTTEVPSGAFLGKSVREAAILYLSLVRKKQTTREIAAALAAGGMESTSKKFVDMVGTVLYQIKKSGGGILRIGDAWGLAEWYPAGFRVSTQEPKPRKHKAQKRKKTTRDSDQKTHSEREVAAPQLGTLARIEAFLIESRPDEFDSGDIASKLNLNPKAIHFFLGKLCKQQKIVKTPRGNYQAPAEGS